MEQDTNNSHTNGWSGKPGEPLNPEQDSDGHVLCVDGDIAVYKWVAEAQRYEWQRGSRTFWFTPDDLIGDQYLGRIVTPAEVTAIVEDEMLGIFHPEFGTIYGPDGEVTKAVAQARHAALEEAAQVVEGMEKVFHASQVITGRCASAIRQLNTVKAKGVVAV
jgi:hypothetical protein